MTFRAVHGVDPVALVEAINEAQEKRAAAQAEPSGTQKPAARVAADLYAAIDSLGDVKKVTRLGEPEELQRLYEKLNVEIVYNAKERTLDASIRPVGRDKASVRGGTFAPTVGRIPRNGDSSPFSGVAAGLLRAG
ncbi:hypothetical protein LFM09_33815 [Lentzea alba]|uniref:hypothetical protein n=1 Tax=Lentzea alba TaxID=2714351 RepID=UPI0039BEF506